MGFVRDWSTAGARILDHLKFKSAPGEIRSVMVDLEDRLASILYGFTAGETIAGIKKGRLITVGTGVSTTPPGTGSAASVDIYSRSDGTGSAVELYALDKAGNETKITKAGVLNPDAITSISATAITALTTTVLASVYPIGCIYATTVATDPATVFGFGTWEAYGAGRVMVGKAAAGTFATAGGTGGAETHTLTVAEVPALTIGKGPTPGNTGDPYVINATSNAYGNVSTTGGGGAHNNLQPFIVTYLWKRTA
jgi:hypothetical protein